MQLLRQPTKNEKRKLVPGTAGREAASPAPSNDSTQGSQASTDRASLSRSMDKMGPGTRDSAGHQADILGMTTPAVDKRQNNSVSAQQATPTPQRASPPSAQAANPGLSQSFDQRTMKAAQPSPQKAPQLPENPSPNAHLRTSVDAAINNVDRALSEMHKQEVDRLKARIDVRSA